MVDALSSTRRPASTSTARRSPPRSTTSRRWATTTSGRRPRSPTGCSTSRWRRCSNGGLTRGIDGREVAARPAPHGRGPRPVQAGRPAQPAEAARASSRSATSSGTTSTSTSRARRHINAIITVALPRPGRAAAGQRRDRAGEGQPLGDDEPAAAVRLPRRSTSTRRSSSKIAAIEATRPGAGEGPQGGPAVLRPPEGPGPADPARRERPGLPGARPHPARTTSS